MNKKELRALKNIKESLIQIALAGDNCNTDNNTERFNLIYINILINCIISVDKLPKF